LLNKRTPCCILVFVAFSFVSERNDGMAELSITELTADGETERGSEGVRELSGG
jgi:hypothetical protein